MCLAPWNSIEFYQFRFKFIEFNWIPIGFMKFDKFIWILLYSVTIYLILLNSLASITTLFNSIQFHWIDLNFVEFVWIHVECNSIEFHWIDSNFNEFHRIPINLIEFNWIGFHWISFKSFDKFHSSLMLQYLQFN